ncbi:MAG TPA: serine/threonine-protein kinase, partial [Pyrinomonadaceae bacterium]
MQNRYAVERQIGQGGMGAVYVATDRRFGSTVALKETFFDDPNLRKAFEREARLLNRLRHAALPRVSDHFEESDGQFLVMEYIAGEDLSQMLKARGSGFPTTQVLGWADQLLDALDYLHTQEPPVIHRDIKPQNLKLTARDQVVLLDFGLAKGTPLQTRVTQTGSLFGYSFNYAPIEQMQGAGTDPRSDLYSLGATLYHLLTGATPPDALTRATAVLNGDPDPLRPASETAAHVPSEVSDVLARAMTLSAPRRYATAEEMRAALREAARSVAAAPDIGNASTLIDTVASEQKTRLMGAGETRPAAAQEAATLIGGGPSSARTDARAAAQTSVEGADGKSVVTHLKAADERMGSRRTLYVVLGLVCLALVGGLGYAYLRGASTNESVARPTPQP